MTRNNNDPNTIAVKALKRSNEELKKELAKLTRKLERQTPTKQSFFLGRGAGPATSRIIERAGVANTARDYRGGGLAAVTAGAIFGSAGALAAGGLTVARQYGKMKSISSDINMTSGQKQMSMIDSVSSMFGGIAQGFIQARYNSSGIARRAQIEQGTISGLTADFQAMALQGITSTPEEDKQMAEFYRQKSEQLFEAGQKAKRLGQDPTLAADSAQAAKTALEDLKAAIVGAIEQGMANAGAQLRQALSGMADDAADSIVSAGNNAAYELGVEAGNVYANTKRNVMNRTGIGWAYQAYAYMLNDIDEKLNKIYGRS